MLDWLSCSVKCVHKPLPSGRIASITPDGAIEWETPKALLVESSHSSKIKIRSQGDLDADGNATELFFSGNPSKFLQGHNVHGSDQINDLFRASLVVISKVLGIDLSEAIHNAANGRFSVKRVDIARSYRFQDSATVDAALHGLCHLSRSRSGRASSYGSTVYLQKGSKRWSFKFYNKFCDPTMKKLSQELLDLGLYEYTAGLLRAEVTLKTLELKQLGMTTGQALNGNLQNLYDDYFQRIDIAMNTPIPSEEIKSLGRALGNSYLLWLNGVDVRNTMTRATFYRHRSQLLPYGVDIAMPVASGGQVIPLFVEARGEPESIPDFLEEGGHIFKFGGLKNVG